MGKNDLKPERPSDPALAEIMRCYLTRKRVSWPWLALLVAAMALLVGGLFLPA